VLLVDGARLAAVQVASIADEGDQVNHGATPILPLSYVRGSA
jgi:hypothetical protein